MSVEEDLQTLHPAVRASVERYLQVTDADKSSGILRYGCALDVEHRVRKAWVDLGQPVLMTFSNGMTGAHPLLKVMQASAKLAADLHKAAGLGIDAAAYRRSPTRPIGAVSAPDRRNAPPRNAPVNRDHLGPLLQVVTYPDGAA